MKTCVSLQVVTFDAVGVSGHSNHVAVYAAVRYDSLADGGGRGIVHLLRGTVSKASSHASSEPRAAYF